MGIHNVSPVIIKWRIVSSKESVVPNNLQYKLDIQIPPLAYIMDIISVDIRKWNVICVNKTDNDRTS